MPNLRGVTDTSAQVYFGEVLPRLGDKQKRVIKALQKSKRPVCNQEIAEYLGQPINTVTPRMNELVKLGMVRMAGKAVYPKTNRRVIYWGLMK